MSYFSIFVFALSLSCGSLVQASAFDSREFGYREEILLNTMVERGAKSYREAAEMLDRDVLEAYQTSGFESYPAFVPKVDMDEELSLALIRSMQEEDKRVSVPKVDINEELSLALIRQLQEKEGGSPSFSPPLVTPTVTYVDPESVLSTTHKGTLRDLFRSAQGYDNSDVHAFNKAWSKTNIATVQGIFEEVFGGVASLSMSALKAEF